MSRDVIFCLEDENLFSAVEKMREREVGRLVVLNQARRLMGLVTLGDLARQLGKDHMAALISESIAKSRRFAGMSNPKKGVFAGVGAVVGLAGIFAGLQIFRARRAEGQSEERAA